MVRAVDLRLYGFEFDSRSPRLVLGWVTDGQTTLYSTEPPGQLSLLPSTRREMSTGQSAVTLCGWEVKAGMVHSTCG